MVERQYTRIDLIRQRVDKVLKECENSEVSRNGFVHLYGVGQACAFIALYRGYDRKNAELAEITGMLHDISKYQDNTEHDHEYKSSILAKQLLLETNAFSSDEIKRICHAIIIHSQKEQVDSEFDEILKDADELQHWLRNPLEEFYFDRKRIRHLARELRLNNII